MRREFIYPHRSVRAFPVSRRRLYIAIGMAVVISAAVLYFHASLLDFHDGLSSFLLNKTGIPSTGARSVGIFPHLGPVSVPVIPFPPHRANPLRTVTVFAVALFALFLIYRRFPLSRNFVLFLIVLLCTAGGVILFNPTFRFDSAMYAQMWLRGEVLVWILLPWVSAFLLVLTLPSIGSGVVWASLLQIYAVVWSAMRLAFCLGVLHFTGILFMPLLWFCLGILFDLVYILVCYSLALQVSIKQAGGERAS